MRHYTARQPRQGEECKECGQPATLVLMADYYDNDGYIDEIPLCNEHAAEFVDDMAYLVEDK
jgi:hypothetical protein